MNRSLLPRVTIVVLNFNGKKYLKDCFESISLLNYPKDRLEAIMGDNASTDDSIQYVRTCFPWVKIKSFNKNYGFCKANNLCAKEATGEYLVFLNNDTYVHKDWLINMVNAVISDRNVVSCACKMYFADIGDGRLINTAGGIFFPTGCGLYEGWLEFDSPEYDKKRYTGFGCGAGVLIQRKFFCDTGGFDEYYFYSGEEMDLGLRVWRYGYKVIYEPKAIMYHYMGATGFINKRRSPSIEFLVMRNKLYFTLKNYEPLNVLRGIFFSILASFSGMIFTILNGNLLIPICVIKAHLRILIDMKTILKKRHASQKVRCRSDADLRKEGVLVGVKEWLKRSQRAKDNMEKFFGSIYDTKDAVRIKRDKDGDLIFYKNSLAE